MKTTLNLDDQVLKKAKQRAARNGITLAKFVEDALKAKLLSAQRNSPYAFDPSIVSGSRPPNVEIADRDTLHCMT